MFVRCAQQKKEKEKEKKEKKKEEYVQIYHLVVQISRSIGSTNWQCEGRPSARISASAASSRERLRLHLLVGEEDVLRLQVRVCQICPTVQCRAPQ